jgi:hypothetical protein
MANMANMRGTSHMHARESSRRSLIALVERTQFEAT